MSHSRKERKGLHNYGLEQTAHCLRQDMRQWERAAGLRKQLRRAAAQAECYTTQTELHVAIESKRC
jgi:hypothetical protein